VQLVIEWDPAQKYEYMLDVDENGDVSQTRGPSYFMLRTVNSCNLKCFEFANVVQMRSAGNTLEFTTSKDWAQDTGLAPPDNCRTHPHGSWHYARISSVSTVTDRKSIGMSLKEKRVGKGKLWRIAVERLEDNEDGSKGAAEKAGAQPLSQFVPLPASGLHCHPQKTLRAPHPPVPPRSQASVAAMSFFKSMARRSTDWRKPMLSLRNTRGGQAPT
jgi:hypothetical protein